MTIILIIEKLIINEYSIDISSFVSDKKWWAYLYSNSYSIFYLIKPQVNVFKILYNFSPLREKLTTSLIKIEIT